MFWWATKIVWGLRMLPDLGQDLHCLISAMADLLSRTSIEEIIWSLTVGLQNIRWLTISTLHGKYAFRDVHGTYIMVHPFGHIIRSVVSEYGLADWEKIDVIVQTTSPPSNPPPTVAPTESSSRSVPPTDSIYPSVSQTYSTDDQPSSAERSPNSLSSENGNSKGTSYAVTSHAFDKKTLSVMELVLPFLYMVKVKWVWKFSVAVKRTRSRIRLIAVRKPPWCMAV